MSNPRQKPGNVVSVPVPPEEITSDTHRPLRPTNPNEFSNSLVQGASTGRITAIVLDFINTPYLERTVARRELLKYLTQSVDQHEATGLYTLTRSGMHMIHDFTLDPRILVAALRKANGGDASRLVDTEEDVECKTGTASPDGAPPVDSGLVAMEAGEIATMLSESSELAAQAFQQHLAITYTLQGMEQLAQSMAGFPGRKSVIWAGGGFPFGVSDNSMELVTTGTDSIMDVIPQYEHTWRMLNAAQIALYPLDVGGLKYVGTPPPTVRNPGLRSLPNMNQKLIDTHATFVTFAAMTGGRAYYNSNDLAKGFHDAVEDSSKYYMLGYYVDESNTKAGWRKLKVKVPDQHVEVRARSGFFVTHAATDSGAIRKTDLTSALASPLDYTSLQVVARWANIQAGRETGKKQVSFQIHLAVDQELIDEADHNHVALEFAAQAKPADGKQVDEPTGEVINTHLPADKVPVMREKGIVYSGALALAPGEYTVRFVVRDNLSGRIGSVAAPLKVE